MTRIAQFIACSTLAIVASLVGPEAASAAPSQQEIEQSIRRAMEEFQVPGMAVSVVYGGQLYYAGGQGLVETGKRQAVDGQTLFQIGSVSKAFTAAALALLADEGKLGWDDRVIDHLPEFRMFDPWVTREFTIRDLVTHRSGLPLGAGDLLVFPEGNATREEIIHALRYLEPSSSFRAKFDYDNLLYIVAGEVVARVAGMSFEEFLEQRLLFPLGMKDCSATLERAAPEAVKATPHLLIEGELQTTTAGADGVIAAAGGINCSARSMALWMSFVLSKGLTGDGAQLISTAQFDQLLQPVTLLPAAGYLEEHAGSWLSAYALGWNVSTFYGQPMLAHGGGLWGMTTFVMLLPQQGLAIFASNNLMSPAPRAIVNELADEFLGDVNSVAGADAERNKDWIAIISGVYKERQDSAAATVVEAAAARAADSRPSLPLAAYAGTYRDPWYGAIHITLGDDGTLQFRSERNEPLQGPLEHFQHDTFIARWTNRQLMADAYVSFSLSPEGGVERIRMKAVSPMTDFSYDFHDLDLKRVAGTVAEPEQHAHAAHGATPELAEGQRWATDAPLREAMLRIRDGVAINATAFHDGTLAAAAGQTLAAAVEGDVQFMIANCRLAPEPDAALHALIGRMLGAAEALRADPASADGLPRLEAVLNDYGATFDHPGWEPPGA